MENCNHCEHDHEHNHEHEKENIKLEIIKLIRALIIFVIAFCKIIPEKFRIWLFVVF